MIDKKKLFMFLGYTFLINWLMGAAFLYLHYQTDLFTQNRFIPMALASLYMLVPAIVSLFLIIKVFHEKPADYGLNFRFNKGWIGAWVLPYLIAALTIATTYLLGWGRLDFTFESFIQDLEGTIPPEEIAEAREKLSAFPPGLQFAMMLFQSLLAGTTLNAFFAFGEEMGWRGFLYKVVEPLGFWRANLLIGVIWGIWHAPLILAGHNFPAHPVLGVFIMTAACMLLSVLFGYVREASGSVIAAAVFHGVFNAIAGVSIIFVADAENIYRSPLGFAGMIAILILIGAAWPVYKKSVEK